MLQFHYRNGLNICKLADGIAKESEDYKPLASTSNYDERTTPSTVEVIRTNTLEEQCNIIFGRIKVQLKAYPNEHIGIITPRREELYSLSQFFMQTDLYTDDLLQVREDGSECFDHNRPIILTTLHSAKGLEFRVLHIAALEYVKHFPKQRNMCFTAVTRAKTAVCVYHAEELPGYFEQAYANMQRPPALPKIEDLFTKEAK
jgi:superfamily I DNA and RNA helicase